VQKIQQRSISFAVNQTCRDLRSICKIIELGKLSSPLPLFSHGYISNAITGATLAMAPAVGSNYPSRGSKTVVPWNSLLKSIFCYQCHINVIVEEF
jgi:hypothetical protein